MADSLRDQLLKAGLVSTSKKTTKNRPDRREGPDQPRRRGGKGRATQTPARTDEELDLARAYALRAKSEAAERRREKAEAERQARLRRERKQEL
nr:DUF2058 domain-containing protein [Oleiagrimonas sp.]